MRQQVRVLRGSPRPYVVIQDADGMKRTKKIHLLVAEAFIENPATKPHVAHNDGNPLNNNVENLRWATPVENNADKFRHGSNGVKLTVQEAEAIKRTYEYGNHTQAEVAHIFGVARSTVGQIVRGEIWAEALLERI